MSEPKAKETSKPSGVIALLSKTGQERYRGTYIVPADKPIILDLATVADRDLGEIEADPQILSVRTDTAVTPESEVRRFERHA